MADLSEKTWRQYNAGIRRCIQDLFYDVKCNQRLSLSRSHRRSCRRNSVGRRSRVHSQEVWKLIVLRIIVYYLQYSSMNSEAQCSISPKSDSYDPVYDSILWREALVGVVKDFTYGTVCILRVHRGTGVLLSPYYGFTAALQKHGTHTTCGLVPVLQYVEPYDIIHLNVFDILRHQEENCCSRSITHTSTQSAIIHGNMGVCILPVAPQ